MKEKVIGYILLALGVVTIIVAAVSVVFVFTGSTKPIELIDQKINLGFNVSLPGETGDNTQVPVKMNQLQPIIHLANLFGYLIFMGFIASIGYKIALIGVQLIRPIVIKAKEESVIK